MEPAQTSPTRAPRSFDVGLTALAPAVWGSTYLVTTELLPGWHPLTLAMLRALPAGLILLAMVRVLPRGMWWGRAFILGALNFSIFWVMLFISAYRLPGGVAATVGAIQPLIVVLLARAVIGTPIRALAVVAALAGIGGVALLVLAPGAGLDPVGVAAGLAGAVAMAAGTVLTRHWQPPVSPLTVTAWQLAAGGVLLLPLALVVPLPAEVSAANLLGLAWLGLMGAALSYVAWFRGIGRLGPGRVAPLALLSPATAVLLGWAVLGQVMTPVQMLGLLVVLGSVLAGQHAGAAAPARPKG